MNYLIDFKDDASNDAITAYLLTNDCEVVKIYDNFAKTYLVSSATTPAIDAIVDSIVDDDGAPLKLLGEIIPVNQYYLLPNPNLPQITVSTTDEKDWWKNYVLVAPDFDSPSIEVTRKGECSNVYIMDSGIDATHPEFVDAQITNLFSMTGEFADTNGHGTALASVISGKTCGLSSAHLKIVKIFDQSQETKQSDLLNALDMILSDFLANPNGVGILNCSWSIPKNDYVEQKIRVLIASGIYVVVSAGNSGLSITDVTPASMPEVLTVGSFNKELHPSSFSNYTDPSIISFTANATNTGALDGWAPGEQIWVAAPGGLYGYASGTSVAAAIHSCVLAYNISDMVDDNAEVDSLFIKPPMFYLASISFFNKDLLNLSDPKYSASANAISTLYNKLQKDPTSINELEIACRVNVGKTVRIFNPQDTKTIKLLSPLPDGCSLQSSGALYCLFTSVIGDYQIFDVTVQITAIDDTVIDKTVKLAVVSETFDITTVPETDSFIRLTLEACWAGCTGSCTICLYCFAAGGTTKNPICDCAPNGDCGS